MDIPYNKVVEIKNTIFNRKQKQSNNNCMINLKKMTGIDHPAQCRCDLVKSRLVLINKSYKPYTNNV